MYVLIFYHLTWIKYTKDCHLGRKSPERSMMTLLLKAPMKGEGLR